MISIFLNIEVRRKDKKNNTKQTQFIRIEIKPWMITHMAADTDGENAIFYIRFVKVNKIETEMHKENGRKKWEIIKKYDSDIIQLFHQKSIWKFEAIKSDNVNINTVLNEQTHFRSKVVDVGCLLSQNTFADTAECQKLRNQWIISQQKWLQDHSVMHKKLHEKIKNFWTR